MHSNGVDGHSDPAGVPLPPALTQRVEPRGDDGGSLPLEPFRFLRGIPQNRADVTEAAQASAEPLFELDLELSPELEAFPATDEDPGSVEVVLDEDVSEVTEALRASAEDRQREFPVDAFIIPDDAERVPEGLDEATVQELIQHEHDLKSPTRDLAERFERLSRRLRAEDIESLLPSLAQGDRFDALVAGFLAGYFSAKNA